MFNVPFSEVIVSSDSTNKSCNVSIRDLKTDAVLTTYKNGNTEARTLAFIGNDYLIGAQIGDPTLRVWTVGKMHREERKFVCPGVVTALSISPNAHYCAAAVREKIYLWLISTGDLVAILDNHYQTVECIKFVSDGAHFVSGGADGLVLVWQLNRILLIDSFNPDTKKQPYYTWHDHTHEVTDIHVGHGGFRARIATASLDQTCKVYDLLIGQMILNVCTSYYITSVTMDPAENLLFLGTDVGKILQVNLYRDMHLKDINYEEDEQGQRFQGHSARVSCLSVSMFGSILLSGSDDKTVRLWDITDGMCLSTIPHAGPITNAFIMVPPRTLLSDEKVRPSCLVEKFKRTLISYDDRDQKDLLNQTVRVQLQDRTLTTFFDGIDDDDDEFIKLALQGEGDTGSKNIVQKELQDVELVNKQLYSYSVNSFLNSLKKHKEE